MNRPTPTEKVVLATMREFLNCYLAGLKPSADIIRPNPWLRLNEIWKDTPQHIKDAVRLQLAEEAEAMLAEIEEE